ncbi:PIN domain-containing protein [Kribbella albertanoniae]|uniref:Ribonuclease VapC n=1 Tax=Kribbella albertanoniae TaxID=1266829 RepID=A0A4R4PHL2_9ACTN|nr:PIN domain-containing protein [Kribbella albertanoniae]TDC21451.1 PIN domain-containing protein [Kribbella albertanoniae]
MIVVDTGPIVAAALTADINHRRCVDLFASLRLNNEQLVIPPFVVTEVCYLLAKAGGSKSEMAFVRSLAAGDFTIASTTASALDRMADLIGQYADLPLGLADASVITLAEQLDLREVATLDRRRFSVVRPRHVNAFTLLP